MINKPEAWKFFKEKYFNIIRFASLQRIEMKKDKSFYFLVPFVFLLIIWQGNAFSDDESNLPSPIGKSYVEKYFNNYEKNLKPPFDTTEECLKSCLQSPEAASGFPEKFSTYISTSETSKINYAKLIKSIPKKYAKCLSANDEPDCSKNLQGSLITVLSWNGKLYAIYFGITSSDPSNYLSNSTPLEVVVEKSTGEMAGWVDGETDSPYAFVTGSNELIGVLAAAIISNSSFPASGNSRWPPLSGQQLTDSLIRAKYFSSNFKNGLLAGMEEYTKTPAPPNPNDWYSISSSGNECVTSISPAQEIRNLQDNGLKPDVTSFGPSEKPYKVTVSYSDAYYTYGYTFYRGISHCEEDLPKNQPTPSKYQ
jgi:hypothetical protein